MFLFHILQNQKDSANLWHRKVTFKVRFALFSTFNSKMMVRPKIFLWSFHNPLALLIHLDTAACRKISEIMDHLQGCSLKFPLKAIPEYFHMSAVFGHLHSAKNPWTRSFALNDVFCLHRKFYIPNTLNNDQFWHPQWVVAALKY